MVLVSLLERGLTLFIYKERHILLKLDLSRDETDNVNIEEDFLTHLYWFQSVDYFKEIYYNHILIVYIYLI